MNAEYGDTDRLAELGANALDLAVTNHFYSVKPFLSGSEIRVCVYASFLLVSVHDSYCGKLTICFGRF